MPPLHWQKSSFSEAGASNCVELAAGTGVTHLRESDDPSRVVTTTRAALRALLRAAKAGEFDHLVP
ncbi:DUF397 domain-containing protein [Streptomyces sp. H27-D2]|uniref:DUF397 domain-containing protein n=1 Tax=Streptomyces sp. H27-D2 TaxID=3046304 RepID=UPI002DBAC583|nr:DUF397 domain-containing protein [Streptomyces sp. H27-D2]MEC4018480.1 DUF397 domain-containing protein [Streptomyces sp. H27-D2]